MRKGLFSKVIVTAVVVLNITFTAAALYAATKGAVIPDSLVVSWFGFTTGELWMLSSIKKSKVKKEANTTSAEDDLDV